MKRNQNKGFAMKTPSPLSDLLLGLKTYSHS
jgi:hypothetical protein